MHRLLISLAVALPLTACGDDRPDVPDGELAAKSIYKSAKMFGIGIESVDVKCKYGDPPRSAITEQWMAICAYKTVFTNPERARRTMREAGDIYFMWHENVTHDGQGAWREYTP